MATMGGPPLSMASSTAPPSLKDKQRAAVYQMLNLNKAADHGRGGEAFIGEWSDQWKVLVYDKSGRDIISCLMNVTQLRKQGVTLHMMLDVEREPIQDVPAVYFCQPTLDNMRRIAQDCSKRLYASMYLNFATKLERPLMESLARETLAAGCVNMISKMFDQYLDFVSLEPRLFSLNQADSYLAYNDPTAADAAIEANMTQVTWGLFSVLATLRAVPVIRAPPGGAAQMVAEQLNKVLTDHLAGSNNLFAAGATPGLGASSYQRPALLILDRSADLVTPLRHCSTYQALLDDVLDHRFNRVNIEVEGKAGQAKKKKTYDVDMEVDQFYSHYKGAPFPEAIEANGAELAMVTQKEEDIRRRTTAAGINVDSAISGLNTGLAGAAQSGDNSSTTRDLAAAVESLPALIEQKKALEMHTNILKAIMDVVAAREVPLYFEAEEDVVMASRADKAKVAGFLSSGKGSLRDKLRLLGVYCLAARPSAAEVAELEEELKRACGNDGAALAELQQGLGAIAYLRRQGSLQHLPTLQADGAQEAPRTKPKMLQGLLAKAQTQATGLLAKAAATATQLLSRGNRTYVTRVVESLLDFGEESDSYLYLDPKLRERVDPATARSRPPPREVVVFVIGGGGYAEFQNLQDFAKSRSAQAPVGITYGSTELLSAEGFLLQLMKLGSRSA